MKKVMEVEQVEPTLIDKLKAKVAEQKNKPRKSIIDWSAVQADNAIGELKQLQKDFKHFVEVSKMVQAEKLFEDIKSCFRNYRTQLAA